MNFLIELFGRAHPLLLHLPIGALALLTALEVRQKFAPGFEWSEGLRRFLISITALFAVVAASAGFVLGQGDSYVGDTIWWHRVLGIALAVCVTLGACSLWFGMKRAYGFFLIAALGLLAPVGHYGATMTHGANYLLGKESALGSNRRDEAPIKRALPEDVDPSSRPEQESKQDTGAIGSVPPQAAEEQSEGQLEPVSPVQLGSGFVDYKTSIAPIFDAYCTDCHGPTKKKGGLALHIPQLVLVGGSEGPVLIAGKPDESLLIKRILLPPNDEDHMPPEGRPQPSAASIEQLRAWIAAGAEI